MKPDLREQLDALMALLDAIAGDRGLLAELSPEERTRLVQAAGRIYNPDVAARRHLVKAIEKRRKAERVSKDERVLHETGIRMLRRQPVFTTPNVFAPPAFDPADVPPAADDEARARAGRKRPERSGRNTATCASSSTRRCTISTISSVRRAPR